jgi:small-conductance mechanosensitive channel
VFVIALAVGLALSIEGVLDTKFYLNLLRTYLLQVFVAALVLIIGLILGDKAEVEIRERFHDVKLPEINLIPRAVNLSILFIASLIALAQLKVETGPLLVLFGGYVFAVVVLGGLAFKDLLAAGAAGMYLLLSQPYSIGDTITVGGHRGIVQEIDVFVTHIESDSEEFILPNHVALRSGIVRVRS